MIYERNNLPTWVFSLLIVTVILSLFSLSPISKAENTKDNHLIRHDESMRIVNLLDKILAKLKDELHGTQENKQHDIQDMETEIQETEQKITRIGTQIKDTTNRLEYLESMKQSLKNDAGDAARSEEQVEKEIELVNKIKKTLIGDQLSASCDSNSDCQEGFECDAGHCRIPVDGDCVASHECVASAECVYGKCTSVVGRGCEVDEDCAGGTVCYNFECRIDVGEQCSTDDQCYTNTCQNRRCKSPFKDLCTESINCESGTVCENNRCLLGREAECGIHGDCATGYCGAESPSTKSNKKCIIDPCSGISCANSLVCDPFEGSCRVPPGGLCSNSTQCINNLTCENEQCLAQINEDCESSEHCISGFCYNGKCKLPSNHVTCSSNDECAIGSCKQLGPPSLRQCLSGVYSYLDRHKTVGRMNIYENRTGVATDNYDHSQGSALFDISNAKGRWYFEAKCVDKRDNCHGATFGIAETAQNGHGKHYGYQPDQQSLKSHGSHTNYGDGRVQYGDVFGIDVDLDMGRIRFSKNGKYFGWRKDVEEGAYFPAVWDEDSHHRDNLNMTFNTGFQDFIYNVPDQANRGWFGGLLKSQCFNDDECYDGLVCRNAQCKLPVRHDCVSDQDCETGHCTQNQCLYHLGEDCDDKRQCASGICRNRLCSVGGTSLLNLRSQMGNLKVSEYRTRVSWSNNDNWRGTILGEVGNEAGKWYYEVECIHDCRGVTFGIASRSGRHDPSGHYCGWNPHNGRLRTSSGNHHYATGYDMRDQDIAGVLIDLDNHRVGFSMNGMWKGWSRTMPQGIYYPAIWDNDNDRIADVRVNFGHYDFKYYQDELFQKGWFGGSILSTCRSNVDCGGQLICDEARCRYPLRDSCSSDNECSTPWCFNNKCLLKVGDYCSYGDECASGECSHGRCSTKQFTTFDPSTAAGETSLSGGFTEVDFDDRGSVLGNIANTYGKWYYEVECMSNNCHRMSAGIATDIGTNTPGGDYYAYSFGYRCDSNRGNSDLSSQNVGDGDIVGVSVDLESGKIGYHLNGNWLGWCYTNIDPNQQYYPVLYDNDNGPVTSAMVNFGYYDFHYDVPSGFNRGWFGGLLLSSCEGEDSEENTKHTCNRGLLCYENLCRLPSSGICHHGDECSTTSCYNGKCVQLAGDRCKQDDECATGSCVEGRCNTGDYAVWNPRLSVGDLQTQDVANSMVRSDDNSRGVMLATKPKLSGRYYYEVECLDDCRGLYVGIATSTGTYRPSGKYMGFEPDNRNMHSNNFGSRSYGSYGNNIQGDVLGIYVDMDNRRMGIKQQNKWMGWFNRNFDELSSGEKYYPAVWDEDNGDHFTIRTNFGFYEWQYEVEEEYTHGWI